MTLIRKDRLSRAVSSYQKRNALIFQLDNTKEEDPQRVFKWVLAYWLGSQEAFPRLKTPFWPKVFTKQQEDVVDVIFHLLIILDRQRGLVHKDVYAEQTIVEWCLTILRFYNNHYSLILSNSEQFLKDIRLIISSWNSLITLMVIFLITYPILGHD